MAPTIAAESAFKAYDVAVDAQRLVVTGLTEGATGERFAVLRLGADGARDASFGTNGEVTTSFALGGGRAFRTLVDPQGRVVAAGYALSRSFSTSDFALARYLPSGALDPSFGTGGTVAVDFGHANEIAFGLTRLPDGDLLATGMVDLVPTRDFALTRYNADGTPDAAFGTGGSVRTDFGTDDRAQYAVALPDGRLLVVGSAVVGGVQQVALARYLPSGALDPSFGTGGRVTTAVAGASADARGATVLPDGRIVAAGSAVDAAGVRFLRVRYTASDALDAAAPGGATATAPFSAAGGSIARVAFTGDGRIVAAGAVAAGATTDVAVGRYLADGTPDATFAPDGVATADLGNGAADAALGVTLQPDGKVVAVGTATVGGRARVAVARFGAPAATYAVTVRALAGAAPVAGATATLPGPSGPATAVTDADGTARFTAAAGASYTVTLATDGAAFLPSSFALTAVDADQAVAFARTAAGSAPVAVTVAEQVTVPPTGATVALPGGIALAVLGGALPGTIALTVGTFDTPPPGAGLAGPLVFFGPPGTTFTTPVTVTVPYTEADVPAGTAETDLRLVRFDEATATYSTIEPSTVDAAANTITAQISSFSGYGAAVPVGIVAADEPPAGPALRIGPNPARTTATAVYTVPTAGAARVTVYDVLGRAVWQATDDRAGAGSRSLVVDVSALPAGVYRVHFVAGATVLTRPLTVVR